MFASTPYKTLEPANDAARNTLEESFAYNDINSISKTQLSSSVLEEIQAKSVEISKVRSWLESGQKPDKKSISGLGYFTKALLSQQNMVKTKVTVRKPPSLICSICKESIEPGESFQAHVEECSKTKVPCEECGEYFKKEVYRKRHYERFHDKKGLNSRLSKDDKAEKTVMNVGQSNKYADESSEESDWDTEPDVELEEGRIFRKRTAPEPVFAPKRRCLEPKTPQGIEKVIEATQSTPANNISKEIGTQTEVSKVEMIQNDKVFIITCPFYKQKELSVKCTEQFIEIKGYKKIVNNKNDELERSFLRRYELPPDVDHDTIKCTVAQGLMVVKMERKSPSNIERNIPIEFCC
ncbi:hypothetical protein ACF0H5_018422 [Mactra antiquata]